VVLTESELPTLIWAAVEVLAIFAIYRVVMRAFDSDHNVDIKWKVVKIAVGQLSSAVRHHDASASQPRQGPKPAKQGDTTSP
jgi:hypothetical protein